MLRTMEAPERVVAEQVNAYNKHDLQRFVNTYADDVEVVGRDGQVIHGHAGLRQTYGPVFVSGPVRAEILGRLTCGECVVDHERAFASSRPPIELLIAYRVSAGRIVTIRMLG
jgi:hypothetical protein